MSGAADRSVTVRRVADRSGIALAPNLGADRSGMLADRTAMDHARSGFDDRSRTRNARLDRTELKPLFSIQKWNKSNFLYTKAYG